jgi:hypothetical protein
MVPRALLDQKSVRVSGTGGVARLRAAFAGSVTAFAVTTPVAAQSGSSVKVPEQVELRFNGGPGCPPQATFVHEVAARVRHPVEWVTEHGKTQIVVTIAQAEGHATGTLQVVQGAHEPARREFVASSCAEISSALALVTALTLDPNARTDALPSPDDVTPPSPSVSAASAASPSASAPPVDDGPAASSLPSPRLATEPARPRPGAELVEPAPRYVAWLGPAASLDNGYAPGALVTFGLSLGARATLSRLFSSSLQLTPLWGKTGVTGPSTTPGSFAWALARLEACPANVWLARWLSFEPCLSAELGRLAAAGSEAANLVPEPVERWWGGGGAALALHASRGHWFARLETHGLFPATRDQFVVQNPYRQVHRPSSFAYGLSLGIGAQFGR